MLDLRLLREEPETVRAALARRGADRVLDDVLAADARRREIVHKVDEKKHEQNVISKQMAKASSDERESLLERARGLKAEIDALEPRLREADEQLEMLAAGLPNLPHESVPIGESDDDNVELRRWGDIREIPGAEDHLDIGRRLGLIDTDRASRASGSRFGYLFGDLVFLELALVRYVLDRVGPHGFTPVVPPALVRREVMYGQGALPGDEAQYYVVQDGLYLTGTSEQALCAIHMEEELEAAELPKRYAAFSPCFRREAGTWGRDTRGIFRVHQFDKVELFSYAHPESSWEEHEFLIGLEEELLQSLEIPYRAMNVCTGELGSPAAKKVDLEAWFPGQGRYRELTSCSNCTDYQSRRLRIRLKGAPGLPHTLNGTGFAIGRTIAAILENYQEPGGGVTVPKVLVEYMPGAVTGIGS
ncbi:MAG TPA: serine--tRNA ligase [Actinomycetota bacterium]|jgi:seryl-tRNA synthetase|nr:serine--tRNA ligase [Actinomycetota bacterium]